MNIKIEFKGNPIELNFFNYSDGKIGIMMSHCDTKDSWGNATLNMPSDLKENEVIIKDYDANRGLYKCLLDNKVINPYRKTISVGLKEAQVCELTDLIYARFKMK